MQAPDDNDPSAFVLLIRRYRRRPGDPSSWSWPWEIYDGNKNDKLRRVCTMEREGGCAKRNERPSEPSLVFVLFFFNVNSIWVVGFLLLFIIIFFYACASTELLLIHLVSPTKKARTARSCNVRRSD